jgi:hypothetical protein
VLSRLIVAFVLLGVAAAGPAELGKPFEMKPGDAVTLDGLRITFDGVSNDSRCPANAVCAWAGDAATSFTLEKPPAAARQRTLHTSGRYERQAAYDAFLVRLEKLEPYPKEGATIETSDYRATLLVTRP